MAPVTLPRVDVSALTERLREVDLARLSELGDEFRRLDLEGLRHLDRDALRRLDVLEGLRHLDRDALRRLDLEGLRHLDMDALRRLDLEGLRHLDMDALRRLDLEGLRHLDMDALRRLDLEGLHRLGDTIGRPEVDLARLRDLAVVRRIARLLGREPRKRNLWRSLPGPPPLGATIVAGGIIVLAGAAVGGLVAWLYQPGKGAHRRAMIRRRCGRVLRQVKRTLRPA